MVVETYKLHDLVRDGELWLTARVITYAKQRGYTPFTSTLEQAWLASIRGLSSPLLAALSEGRSVSGVVAEADYGRDPIACYGIEAARRHRSRGITLGLFLGLMKAYRRAYLDLVETTGWSLDDQAAAQTVLDNFFDRMEVGFSDEWAGKAAGEQLAQLSAEARRMTNEKNKYLTIFESLNDPVILVDADGAVENMNFAATALFSTVVAPGATYYGDAHPALTDLIGVAIDPDGDLACQRELPTNRGARWFDIKTQRMLDVSEKYVGTVVILVDVTDTRIAREEAEQANRAKSVFLATMSHEIRTPIHGILGAAELLLQHGLAPRERRYAEAIARSGEMLSAVVADILDFTRIEAGSPELDRVEFSVAAAVEDVLGLMRPLVAGKPGLDLVLDVPALPMVVGDPAKLRQILLNLVGNAVKFTDSGTVRLTVAPVDGPADRRTLAFTVADTGIGIEPDRLDAVFEPFTQADGSIGRRYGGNGLGLAICRRLVDLFGGRIALDSRVGEGTRVTVTLAFEPGVERPQAGGTDRPAARSTARPLDVLVVEDNEINAMVAKGLLARAGHRPSTAGSGRAALQAIADQRFDVVLMDLRLPDMEGIAVTRQIRALADPVKAAVPIVALSAQALGADAQAWAEVGIDDFLGKPFRFERLEQTLRRVTGMAGSLAPHPASEPGSEPEPAIPDLVTAPTAELDDSVLIAHLDALGQDQTALIVAAFQDSARRLAADLDRFANDRRLPAIGEVAHVVKSSSLHVGLGRLSARAAEVERQARAGTDTVPAMSRELAADLARSAALLDRAFRRLSYPHRAEVA